MMFKREILLCQAVSNSWTYNKSKQEAKKQGIKFYSKQNFYRLRCEQEGGKVKVKGLEDIKKYDKLREKIFDQKRKEHERYKVEIVGTCKIYKEFPDGTKKYLKPWKVFSYFHDSYQEAKEAFINEFEIDRARIWESYHGLLELEYTITTQKYD